VDTPKVRDAKDVEQVVRAAVASEQPLEIIGHGSKRQVGQPMATNAVLDLSALNAITAYEPNELIITVQAGAPLADVKSLIDSKNQQFAFDPMDTAPLLGTSAIGTIGGMIAAGLAGPRRVKAGGARDHLLGAHAVSGFGDSFKTGGRVVKNVTGYDLCKLLAGSWGTLAVMTEVTLKVMPRPESERTLLLRGLDDVTANKAMTAALGSPFDVSAFEAAGPLGAWPVWRIVCPPASGGALGQALARESGGDVIYDWGGGLIWAALPPKPDAQAALLRRRVEAAGGHATLLRASEEVRRHIDVFHPQAAGVAALGERVRNSFDPKNILNRGRMARGTAT
jgi:glycolate oxidase FAD binding subunit